MTFIAFGVRIRPKLVSELVFSPKYPVLARRYSMQISFVAPSNVTAKEGGAWVVGAAEGSALLPAAARLDKASGGGRGGRGGAARRWGTRRGGSRWAHKPPPASMPWVNRSRGSRLTFPRARK